MKKLNPPLTIARRLPCALVLWPLLLVCTYLILMGWGKETAAEFWTDIT